MDLLLDVNIVVDLCVPRPQWYESAQSALRTCEGNFGRVWLYTGSVQTLLYNLHKELRAAYPELSAKAAMRLAQQRLTAFATDKQWLAALATEGNVFGSEDPEDEQLVLALDRFAPGKIALLTRDQKLLDRNNRCIMAPSQYVGLGLSPKPIDFIDLKTQQDHIRPALEANIHRVLHHGQYIMGSEVAELEQKLATYTGSKHCITCASGTEALLMSLMALGIGPGDEVITTPFTFAATAEMIVLVGATPIFVDIERDTCLIDASLIEAKITPRTKAIMPVSLYGQVCDMDEINAMAARHSNIPVIEDAAQSFGASYSGTSGVNRKSCNLSTIGCTSFFPSKPLGCYGDGGAIFTNDDALAKAMREIRIHGQEHRYYHTRVGVGGRMDTLQCAVVLAKLERFDWEIEQRLALGDQYQKMLTDAGLNVKLITVRPDRDCVWAQFTIIVENRTDVQKHLQAQGVPTATHYPLSLNMQPAYKHLCCPECTPNSHWAAERVMSLPLSPDLRLVDQSNVISSTSSALVATLV